jgi:bifunctional enzyme CysN/CysC
LPFHEVYIKADLATCESRDPKGLYKKARAGEIPEFTGVSAPYEPPQSPDLVIDTESLSPEEALEILVRYVDEHFALDTKVWGYSI